MAGSVLNLRIYLGFELVINFVQGLLHFCIKGLYSRAQFIYFLMAVIQLRLHPIKQVLIPCPLIFKPLFILDPHLFPFELGCLNPLNPADLALSPRPSHLRLVLLPHCLHLPLHMLQLTRALLPHFPQLPVLFTLQTVFLRFMLQFQGV